MMRLRAEVQNGGTKQAPLHAALDLQARVGNDEFLETGDVSAVIILPTEMFGKCAQHVTVGGKHLELVEYAQAVVGHREALDALHVRARGDFPGGEAHVGPGAEQLTPEFLHVHHRGGRITEGLDRARIDADVETGVNRRRLGAGTLGRINHG